MHLSKNSRAYVEGALLCKNNIKVPNENLISVDIFFNKKRLRIFTARLESFELYTDTAEAEKRR